MAQQQMQLQAMALWSNAQQLVNLGRHMSNVGSKVNQAIASNSTWSTIHATISQTNAIPGQSMDPSQMGSLTRRHPVGLSAPGFDYGPYAQSFQPQRNDKKTRQMDAATHQIIQKELPPAVQCRYDAAHSNGIMLPAQECIDGYQCQVSLKIDPIMVLQSVVGSFGIQLSELVLLLRAGMCFSQKFKNMILDEMHLSLIRWTSPKFTTGIVILVALVISVGFVSWYAKKYGMLKISVEKS